MLGASRLGDLARREALLGACLSGAAAMIALAQVLGQAWLTIAGLALAALGGVVRVILTLRRGRLERAQESATLDRRILVPIAGVEEVDPTDVGVDAAAPQDVLPGERVPQYLARDVDAALDAALGRGLDGNGPWIVVAVGSSKVGKSRALFEALRRCAAAEHLDFLAPVDGKALISLLTPGEQPALHGDRAVLWLDDLEPFLNDGTTLQILREWHEQIPHGVVVATYGGKGNDLVGETGSEALATLAGEVLQHAAEILVEPTSAEELGPLRQRVSEEAVELIERHGLAAYLIAAPELQRKLTTHRHAPGEAESPEGVAIALATVDWARCGRTDPISEDALRQIWTDYLPNGMRETEGGFDRGLEWALLPVAGSIALLEHSDGFQAYDYVIRFVAGQPATGTPRDRVWASALEGISGSQALAVGITAAAYERQGDAVEAFAVARNDSTEVTAAIGGVDLGIALGELGRAEEAVAAYEEVVARFGDSAGDELGEQVAKALFNKGVQLGKLDRAAEAIAVYDEVVARFGDSAAEAEREAVGRALVNKGIRLGALGRNEEEIAVYDEVVARFETASEEPLQEAVGRALFNKAVTLGELDRPDDAVVVYDDILARFGEAEAYLLRERVAKTLLNKGIKLGDLDRTEEELKAYEEIVRRSDDATQPVMLEILAKALASIANVLSETEGRSGDALAVYDELVARFGDSRLPVLCQQVASALNSKAIAFGEQDQPAEAVAVLDDLLARYGESDEPILREHVARALNNKGIALTTLERPEEAIEAYAEVIARYGDSDDPILREGVARSIQGRAVRLGDLGRLEEELAAYDDLIARYDDPAEGAGVEIQVAMAMFNKAVRLGQLGQPENRVAAFEDLIARFGESEDPGLQAVVTRATEAKKASEDPPGP
jgi:tetratricopeptide (TPR) repeat protein